MVPNSGVGVASVGTRSTIHSNAAIGLALTRSADVRFTASEHSKDDLGGWT